VTNLRRERLVWVRKRELLRDFGLHVPQHQERLHSRTHSVFAARVEALTCEINEIRTPAGERLWHSLNQTIELL
jgi:hypothetical protein